MASAPVPEATVTALRTNEKLGAAPTAIDHVVLPTPEGAEYGVCAEPPIVALSVADAVNMVVTYTSSGGGVVF